MNADTTCPKCGTVNIDAVAWNMSDHSKATGRCIECGHAWTRVVYRSPFRVGDHVQVCQWDADEHKYLYGPETVIVDVYGLSEPTYIVRNEANGRICHRFEWELVRVPYDGPMS